MLFQIFGADLQTFDRGVIHPVAVSFQNHGIHADGKRLRHQAVERSHVRGGVAMLGAELGLVEMTRKRTRESLAHVLCEPCPMCGGRGEVRTARTVCYSIMREIVRLCKQYQETKEFHIQASQTVIDMLLEEESQALELLQAFVEKPVHLEVEPSYTQEQFDVILA